MHASVGVEVAFFFFHFAILWRNFSTNTSKGMAVVIIFSLGVKKFLLIL